MISPVEQSAELRSVRNRTVLRLPYRKQPASNIAKGAEESITLYEYDGTTKCAGQIVTAKPSLRESLAVVRPNGAAPFGMGAGMSSRA